MSLKFPFDPLERAQYVEDLVMHDNTRLYYRFRASKFYGGVSTADAVGCSFLCAFCWNYDRNLHPDRYRTFYSPRDVVSKLLNVAAAQDLNLYRISGSEPLLGEKSLQHSLQVIRTLFRYRPDSQFILETNGLFLGAAPDIIPQLRLPNLRVRVSLKGTNERNFEKISGAKKMYFYYPLTALCEMGKQGIPTWPALMKNLFSEKQVKDFKKLLTANGVHQELELEELQSYPHVLKNLKKNKLQIA